MKNNKIQGDEDIICLSCETQFSKKDLEKKNGKIKILYGNLNLRCPDCGAGTLREKSYCEITINH